MKKTLLIIWYASLGKGLSGGDNILIELTRRWADKLDITIVTGKEGYLACQRKNLTGVMFDICPSHLPLGRYIERLFWALRFALRLVTPPDYIYSSSDFAHDVLPAVVLKKRFLHRAQWVAGVYQVAPTPFCATTPYRGLNYIRGIGYWLTQQPLYWLIRKYADKVCITSEPEKEAFKGKKVVVVRGGVNIPTLQPLIKTWDAVFMGRLHYQKGIPELIEIWKLVKKQLPNFKLLVIGDGPLRNLIKHYESYGLEWIPFADDEMKEELFRYCKIFLHTSTYDSGGMSCAEAMVYGLPAVGFNLPVYDTYYPQGMLLAKNNVQFAFIIERLLKNKELYIKLSKEARELMVDQWDWSKRAEEIFMQLFGVV